MSTEVKEEEMEAALEERVQEEVIGRLQEGAADQHQAHIIRQLHPITKVFHIFYWQLSTFKPLKFIRQILNNFESFVNLAFFC